MHLPQRTALLAGALILFASDGFCWGPQGHRMVAAVAFSQMGQPLKAKVAAILGPEDFVGVSSWADDVRDLRPATRAWHFTDIPVTAAGYDPVGDCAATREGDCAVQELARAMAVLKDTSQAASARDEALKFIIHFVGDIHQPLHSATNNARVGGDGGGNSVTARLLTHTMNLHAVWDHGILELDKRTEANYVDGLVADLVVTGKADASGAVTDWVNEAHGLAATVAYTYPGFVAGKIPTTVVALTQAYANLAKPVVDLQLARAGVRLARILQDVLGGQ